MNEIPIRTHRKDIHSIQIRDFKLGGGAPLFLIAGPCLVEDVGLCVEIAREAQNVCRGHDVSFIFKASYDKANKTIKGSYRGPGWRAGLDRLFEIKSLVDVPILTDIHEPEQCKVVAKVVDVLQIPALLSKQIDLILAAAETKLPVNIKKGQFTAPWEMSNVLNRLADHNYHDVLVTERGYMFGYQTLISDMRSLQIMSSFGNPVVFDASHSVHSNEMITAGGKFQHRDFIRPLTRSAIANGVDGIFVEIHPEPDKALSDAAGTLALKDLDKLVDEMVKIDQVLSE